jgi:hypothetical protein
MDSEGKSVLEAIDKEKELSKETTDALVKLIEEFKPTFVAK